ncbi:MAG: hypothetical protein FK734_06705 [Asgard group archaeon]|nr:hypothetical protein [Asgard group archaeon]
MSFYNNSNNKSPFLSKTDFKKIARQVKTPFLIGLVFSSISIILAIIGLGLLGTDIKIFNLTPIYAFSAFGLAFGLIVALASRPLYMRVKEISKAVQEEDTKILFSFLETDLTNKFNLYSFQLALFALIDVNPREFLRYLDRHLEELRNNPFLDYNQLNIITYSLARKLGYSNSNEMFADYRGEKKLFKRDSKEMEDLDLRIPITKVYFIDELPTQNRSMVSGLPIDLENEEIVACPNCGNMAERRLLENWLLKNKTCPVCKKIFSIEDYPLVKLSK